METSVYTKATLNPVITIAAIAGIDLGIAALLSSKNKSNGGYSKLRSGNMINDSQVREDMEVVGFDEARVGTVS
jgi:hypothetical protein